MKKKALLIALLAAVVSTAAVSAEGGFLNISYPNDDSVLVISGNAGAGENVSIRVLALGEDGDEFFEGGEIKLDDITEADLRDNPGLLDYFNIVKSNADGSYEFRYKTEGESGFYLFTVTSSGGRQENRLYEYYTPEYAIEKIAELNGYIENNETDKITEFLKRFIEPLAAENDYFIQMQNESYFSEFAPIIIEGGAVKDKADLRERVRIATARVALKHFDVSPPEGEKSEVEKMLEYFTEFGLTNDTLYSKTLQETVIEDVRIKILKDFSAVNAKNDEEMKEQIDDIILLGAVNYSEWGKIQAVFEENIDLFSSSVKQDYGDLTTAKKAAALKTAAQDVKTSPYKSFEALEKGLEDAIEEQGTIKTPEPPGGGGGSGSSGGNKGTSGGGYLPTTNVKPGNNKDPENPSDPQVPEDKKTFADLNKAEWAREAVEYLAGEGIISGRSETEFAPNENITREEFLAIAVRAFGLLDKTASCDFDDVPEDAWFYSAVASAKRAGITSGVSDTHFGAGTNITRQDMCVLAAKAAEKAGISLEEGALEFADADAVSDYAKPYVSAMSSAEIVSGIGDNKFAPRDTATRASAARIIYELLNLK